MDNLDLDALRALEAKTANLEAEYIEDRGPMAQLRCVQAKWAFRAEVVKAWPRLLALVEELREENTGMAGAIKIGTEESHRLCAAADRAVNDAEQLAVAAEAIEIQLRARGAEPNNLRWSIDQSRKSMEAYAALRSGAPK